MRRFRFLALLVFLSVASAVPLEALPPGSCYGNECVVCSTTVYEDGGSSTACEYIGNWGYCTCRLTVGEGCTNSGTCYYHP